MQLVRKSLLSLLVLLLALFVPLGTWAAVPSRGDDGEGQRLKGIVRALPETGLVGAWTIGPETVQVNAATRFEDGTPTLGSCVEVEFTVANGQKIALKVSLDDDCAAAPELQEVHASIESLPEGLVGTWRIGGQNYTATEATRFQQRDGAFAVGTCVEVAYVVRGESRLAISIKTDDSSMCNPGSATRETKGIILSLPAGDRLGTWKLLGPGAQQNDYVVNAQTRLVTDDGDFAVGVCVEVTFTVSGTTSTALSISTESLSDCRGSLPPDDRPGLARERGLIEARPTEGLFGTWRIGGKDYTARERPIATLFDRDYGDLTIGQCAEVAYVLESGNRIAARIASKPAYACRPATEENVIFGLIRSLPSGTNQQGTWVVGGLPFQVNAQTKLEGGPFQVGQLVRVSFTRAADGTLTATKIEGRRAIGNVRVGKSYGRLASLPSTPDRIGTWKIGDNDYSVTSRTRQRPEAGPFQTNACVEVHFMLENGTRTALRVATTEADDCERTPDDRPLNRSFGFVAQLPASGFVGTWTVGGNNFEVRADTEIEQERGAIGVGSFVAVSYVMRDGVKVAVKIRNLVPPGGGDDNNRGVLRNGPTTAATGDRTWTINGQAYVVNDATFIDETAGPVSDGRIVTVNAYTDGSGRRVATSVSGIGSIFLPVVTR